MIGSVDTKHLRQTIMVLPQIITLQVKVADTKAVVKAMAAATRSLVILSRIHSLDPFLVFTLLLVQILDQCYIRRRRLESN